MIVRLCVEASRVKDFMRFGDMSTETPGCDGGAAICRDMYRGISPPSPTDSHGSVTRGALVRTAQWVEINVVMCTAVQVVCT